MKAMFKFFNDDSEWEIFQNVITIDTVSFAKSKKEKTLLKEIKSIEWSDNTGVRPDFISDEIMIEMFEIDDIVCTKKEKIILKEKQMQEHLELFKVCKRFFLKM